MIVKNWIDVHAHFMPPLSESERDDMWAWMQQQDWGGLRPADLMEWKVEKVLDYMDRIGIAMQMLSNLPKNHDALRASNDFGASVVAANPSRFGLLAALPTDDPDAALAEIERGYNELNADGFAVMCCYNGVYLSDARLDPVWAELDRRGAVVFAHPDAGGQGHFGRPSALLEVAFETTRTVVDMIYRGVFRRFPEVRLVLAHCGGALPALSGRLMMLGTEAWVPNPNRVTQEDMRKHLHDLFYDTAMAGFAQNLLPTLEVTTCDHIVYGSDCNVPCTTETTAVANIQAILDFSGLTGDQINHIGRNALKLFPAAAARMAAA